MNIIERHRLSNCLKKIEVIIWDLDETLYFSPRTINQIRDAYLRRFVGRSKGQKLIKEFESHEQSGKKWFQIVAEKKKVSEKDAIIMTENSIDKAKFVSKNPKLVKYFRKSAHRHIILTNSPRNVTWSVLHKIGFDSALSAFNHVFTIEDMVHPKPNLKMLRKILKIENVTPQQTISIGDSVRTDVLPAKRVGMVTCQIIRSKETIDRKYE